MDTIVHLIVQHPGSPDTGDLVDELGSRFYEEFDGTVSARGDQLLVTVYDDLGDPATDDAVVELIERVETTLGVRVVELDLDLVSISDIAERTGRTRQSVRLLVEGSRGPGQFPAPLGTPGGSKVWDWAAVNRWLVTAMASGDAEKGLDRIAIQRLNSRLAQEARLSA